MLPCLKLSDFLAQIRLFIPEFRHQFLVFTIVIELAHEPFVLFIDAV